MNKHSINKYLKKIGIEIHGSGYIRKLLGRQQNKHSFESQAELLNNNAEVIFDIGANKGLTTNEYLRLFPTAQIYAFEPFQDHFPLWKEITQKNSSVHFIPKGVSEISGSVSFNVNNNTDTNSILDTIKIGATSDINCKTIRKETIEVTSIDEFCITNNIAAIDILKIDTQGSELAILKGMTALLENKKVKLIFTETYFKQQYADQPLFFEIAQYLKGYGYYVQDIYDTYYGDRFLLMCDTIFMPEIGH